MAVTIVFKLLRSPEGSSIGSDSTKSRLAELHGIIDQVDDYLPDTAAICLYLGQFLRDIFVEDNALITGQTVEYLYGVDNAMKFSDPGTDIAIKAESRNGELFFQVSDGGIGIPEEAIPHLFERFYRAEDTLVRGGAGLGLYISKQIIEAHGGRIQAQSRVGEGSTFSFSLPLSSNGGDAHG